jgi:2-polyprenyl-6-methoxyphenol hydroxylase-like FAD-dependent oxidoreductase
VRVPRRYRIGIVGYGIAGAAAAYLLARSGHAVTLLERAPSVKPIGAGLLLQPSGQAVLSGMGLLDRVLGSSAPIKELRAVRHGGRNLIRMPYGEFEPGCQAYGLHRGALFSALMAAVESQPIEVRLGRDVRNWQLHDGLVQVSCSDGAGHGQFDFVIAADGSRSALRAMSGLPHVVAPYKHGALWATGPCADIRDTLYQVCCGTRYLLGVLPIGEGRCSLYWGVPVSELDAIRSRGLSALKAELLAFCPEVRELVDSVRDLDQLVFTTYRAVGMPRWHTRRVLFIGDAAHATSPHLGQGASVALLDAWVLAEAVERASDPPSAFRLYARRRAAHVRYYSALTYLLSPFFQGDGRWKGVWRDLTLPILSRAPVVRGQMLLTMCGFKNGWLGGRLSV